MLIAFIRILLALGVSLETIQKACDEMRVHGYKNPDIHALKEEAAGHHEQINKVVAGTHDAPPDDYKEYAKINPDGTSEEVKPEGWEETSDPEVPKTKSKHPR